MVEKTYDITFDGYWIEENKGSVLANSGVYCVYECAYNQIQHSVSIKGLIYIGEAGNVNDRISNHEKQRDWNRYANQGNTLCYSFALIGNEEDRVRVEAALIFYHKPPVNTEYKDNFPFDTTHINTNGQNFLLDPKFIVRKTERSTESPFIRWH